ncbi:S-adenosyl-L-methionine-dependent methyltransferase [Diaporthe sp. PMI_573]|nr:S-adenosyl-L-methionine-dependent methyltransferase [Diaporthaceae sp. PMI_573]
MKNSFLTLPKPVAQKLSSFAEQCSVSLPPNMLKHWHWSVANFPDADKMCSILQLKQIASDRKVKRVLDIGCYTGFSAMAWFEGTVETGAEIITVEADSHMASVARDAFVRFGYDRRIAVLEGSSPDILHSLNGQFDLVFVDMAFGAYLSTIRVLLEQKLLAPDGVILVDNVFARGFVVDKSNVQDIDVEHLTHWKESGELMRVFNTAMSQDQRVETLILPVFDGISEIRWRKPNSSTEPSRTDTGAKGS